METFWTAFGATAAGGLAVALATVAVKWPALFARISERMTFTCSIGAAFGAGVFGGGNAALGLPIAGAFVGALLCVELLLKVAEMAVETRADERSQPHQRHQQGRHHDP